MKNPLTADSHERRLSLEEIETVASSFKEDLTRECERKVRRNDNNGALAAIVGKEYIDNFVYALKMNSRSQIGMPRRARPIRIFRLPKAGT
jgi:hypothetical protein